MDGFVAVSVKVFHLFGTPFDANVFGCIVVGALHDFASELGWEVDVEYFWQYGKLCFGNNGFDARDDGDVDACFATAFGEVVEAIVVEKHLCDDV